MSDMWFIWRGVSSEAHGVVVRSLPTPIAGAQRHTTVIVPGRHGALHLMENARDEALVMIECYLPYEQGVSVSARRTIAGWLTGSGQLVVSDQPGVYFRGSILDAIIFQPVLDGFADCTLSVPVWIKPHAYVSGVSDIVLSASGAEVVNPYTAESEPAITVAGSGDVVMDIGGVDVELNLSDGPVTLDCEARLAHRDGVLVGGAVSLSEWPTLRPGTTTISWSGSVSNVTISPRWRWI